jgi:hypothetical protein
MPHFISSQHHSALSITLKHTHTSSHMTPQRPAGDPSNLDQERKLNSLGRGRPGECGAEGYYREEGGGGGEGGENGQRGASLAQVIEDKKTIHGTFVFVSR